MPKRILIAEDDSAILELLKRITEDLGYRALTADNGDEALEIAQRELPDLVLTDTEMPGLSGYVVCNRLKRNPNTAHIKVIGMTGEEDKYREQYERASADGYLTKPLNFDILESTLTTLLEE